MSGDLDRAATAVKGALLCLCVSDRLGSTGCRACLLLKVWNMWPVLKQMTLGPRGDPTIGAR